MGFYLFIATSSPIRNLYQGSGTVIATEGVVITLYGLEPLWFWDSQEISRPEVVDVIEVRGYTVEYNAIQQNVVTSITVIFKIYFCRVIVKK